MRPQTWPAWAVLAMLVAACVVPGLAQAPGPEPRPSDPPCSDTVLSQGTPICKGGSGTLLPAFNAYGEADWPEGLKIVLYFVGLLWTFAGVGIITDVFMEAIEVITSRERHVMVDGIETTVLIWNPTIANLSLMALGSSAPEIILSIIEIVAGEFFAGALGPSTIVGSAAFNLFVIIAVCLLALPAMEVRRIESMGVFLVTAIFSIFAYIWLLIILIASSPDVIEIWEGVVTLLFFPILLGLSLMADRGYFDFSRDQKPHPNEEELQVINIRTEDGRNIAFDPYDMAVVLKDVETEALTEDEIANIAAARKIDGTKVSRARFRIDANRRLRGAAPLLPDWQRALLDTQKSRAIKDSYYAHRATALRQEQTFGFMTIEYHVREDAGAVTLTIVRTGDLSQSASIGIETQEGTAKAGSDYVALDRRVEFAAGQAEARVSIEIVDDDEPEDDEFFLARLKQPQPDNYRLIPARELAKIIIVDDDKPGEIEFEQTRMEVEEDCGCCEVVVRRRNGTKGAVACRYFMRNGSAIDGHDYEGSSGELQFQDGQATSIIRIPIIKDNVCEPDEFFTVHLEEVSGSTLGKVTVCRVVILNDDKAQRLLEKVSRRMKINMDRFRVGSSDWKQQFRDAVAWPEREAGVLGIVMHLITLPWKVLAACIPPTVFVHGWVAFGVALCFIGLVTALIGDLASLFGCSLGLADTITAITFVALGTSLPDTFASRSATLASKTADAAVTNVTGSNSVNVFLGLGLSWFIAAVYWPAMGATDQWRARVPTCLQQKHDGAFFYVPAGDLAFSVVIFTCCCLVCLGSLLFRRYKFGAELGGPYSRQFAFFFIGLWIFYVLMSSLQVEGYIASI
ncbi:uncharacterized protein MONBRDRAFT_29670 [Monosiga brevicollis MX1]|uniref:Calx-beta domain-containing protein n=1 Tax=Monosiga brevicollis TaxID=81824 RepID=A9VBS9_MONBE|nr:uncharacterized protein MONBRDRAFT_29670 [Monosiga brevicollis MX1]EDQ85030.1 predicted protein [Monosiga brevicollis MX1]|eukprot:XP_001750200.1 hypothetical protein [Monosiga brevicollis MX1]